VTEPAWIPRGTAFGPEEMAWYQGRGDVDLDDVLDRFDLIVTGPHASAAFPEEVAEFVQSGFTRRLQFDFTDCTTSPMSRFWAELSPQVLYIEDPHPRAVRDANRARPADLLEGLREAFRRVREAGEGPHPSLAGVDAVRPVTFGFLPVYREPRDEVEWQRLGDALATAGALGIDRYEEVRDDLIERVVEAKCRRLAGLDIDDLSPRDRFSATTLAVLSMHDTMNHTARPDGAICQERQPEDRLPGIVALSNLGDAEGEVRASEDGALLGVDDVPSLPGPWLRSLGEAYRQTFAGGPEDVAYNRPYLGGYETRHAAPRLRELAPRTAVRTRGGETVTLALGAYQNEFCREFLLGEEAAAELMAPGTDWPEPPVDRLRGLAERLEAAHEAVRQAGFA
jgi:hypothetical protein